SWRMPHGMLKYNLQNNLVILYRVIFSSKIEYMDTIIGYIRGYSTMVVHEISNLMTRVRFSLPAHTIGLIWWL
ncbi:MAG: hypothetical protein UR48_C0015G0001, partial [Microgenomates group bacterium GW2011_GWD1_33_9]